MSRDPFRFEGSEPLGLFRSEAPPPPHYDDLRSLRFEYSSRGDRVPARLLLPPAGEGPFPVVLLQHGGGGSKEADYLDATGGPWARRGVAVASIDFPLHGERAEAKLSARVLQALARRELAGRHGDLVLDLFRQAVADLQRAVDALEALPEVDAGRLGYAGFSMGTVIGSVFCGVDPRPRAAAFAIGGAGLGPPGADATDYVGRIAPRPVLFVNTTRDETFPRASVEALYAAAEEPKELQWFDGTHTQLPGAALKAMWRFLSPQLGVDDGAG